MLSYGKGFRRFAYVVMTLLALMCIIPFILMISSSLTEETALIKYGYSFWPKILDFSAYEYLFADGITIVRAYGITILCTILGTALGLVMTTMLAYGLALRDLPGRNIIAFLLFFTMLFSGGTVPSYIMWSNTFHVTNTLAGLIIPNFLVGAFYVIMMRTYFQSNIPEAIVESARIDGASELRILGKIVLPMSLPIMATVGMMVAIMYWNDWMNGLYYINDQKLYSIQMILNQMLQDANALKTMDLGSQASNIAATLPSTGIKMAVAVLGAVPIMIVFPFFQKFYVKGITIGAVKG